MAAPSKYDLFLSYSRHDEDLLRPLSQLLKLGNRTVFRDQDSIDPGCDFAVEIEQSIAASALVAVFWCCKAADSAWVDRELAIALQHEKKIVPVLLCPHALPATLTRIQWIDMTGVVNHECGHAPPRGMVMHEPDPWAYPFQSFFDAWWKANADRLAPGARVDDEVEHRQRTTELIVFRALLGLNVPR